MEVERENHAKNHTTIFSIIGAPPSWELAPKFCSVLLFTNENNAHYTIHA
jgi:hypothetical protein